MTEQTWRRFKKPPPKGHISRTHAFHANMHGFAFYRTYDRFGVRVTDPSHTVDVPDSETLIYIMTYFPDIITDTDTILDSAQSSSLGKFILLAQISWFCINCLSRLHQHLPLTLLEASTAAHAFCTILTYIVWWSKPLNVAVPTMLGGEEAREVYALLKCSRGEYDEALAMARAEKGETGGSGEPQGTQARAKIDLAANALRRLKTPQRPPNSPEYRFRNTERSRLVPGNISNESPNKAILVPLAAAICPMVFGPIHFLVWNDTFPTPIEQRLWYVSSGVVTCSGLVGVCLAFFLMMLDTLLDALLGSNRRLNYLAGFMAAAVPAIHMLASGFLIVESFRQLAYLDPPSYQIASWAKYWPHMW